MLHFQRWKVILILGIVIAGFLFALPNVFPAATVARLPTWLPHKQVNLGLDLQGGAHLLYQLDEKEMIEDWLGNIRGDVRETLRKDRIGYSDLGQNLDNRSVSVTIREPADLDKAYTALRALAAPVGGDVFAGFSGYDLDVAKTDTGVTLTITDQGLAHRMTSAIQASIETIRRRVDAFGTTEPSIQREGRNRVLVQVPGIQDVERLKTLIGETGKLEFKLVDPAVDAVQAATTKQVPPGDELVYGTRHSARSICVERPGAGHRPEPGRRAARLRQPHRRAGGDVPLRRRRRQALRQGDPGECRAALRHRARQQGGLRAGDPRADPRRHRTDQRQFHRAAGQRPCRAAPIRRAARQAHRHRGTNRRREPWRGLDRVGQEGRHHGALARHDLHDSRATGCSACSPISR